MASPEPSSPDAPAMEPANLSRAALGAFRALTARPIAARVPLDAALDVDGVDGALDGPMPNGTPAKGKKKTMKPTKGSKGASEDGRAAGSARFLAKVAAAPLGDAGSSADAQFLLLLTVQSDGIHGHVPGRGPVVSRSVPPGTSFACPAVFLADSTNEEEPSGTIAVAVNVAPDVPPAEVGRQIWAWPVPGPATRQEPVKRTLDLPIFALEPLPGRLLLALHSDGSATFVETSKGLIVKRQAASPFSGQRVLWAEVINGSQATEDVFTALSLITSDINGRLNFARVDVRRDFVLAPTVGAELSASLEAGTTFAYAEDDSSSQLAVAGPSKAIVLRPGSSQPPLVLPATGTPLFLSPTHLLLLTSTRAVVFETLWGTPQLDQSLDLAGDLTVTRFGTEVAIVTAKKSGEKFEAAMQSAAFAVPAATTIAAALGRLAPLPSDELGAISKAAEAADARKFDKAFARAFLSKDSVSDDDFPSAYPAIPPHSVGQIVALAMGGAFEASGKFPQSLIFLLRTHLASSHSGEWAAKVVDMCSGPAVKAALLHVQDLGETVVAAALARGLGRKPEGSVELSDAEKEEIVKLALTYPCTRGELVASLRRGLSPDEWAAAWSWIAGKLDAENLEEGEWLWAEVAEPEKKEKEIKKKGKGKKNKERKEKESDDVWLPGPKGEKAMLEKRLAFGLEQFLSIASLLLDANVHHAVLTPELHPTLAKLRALLQSSVDLYRSYDGLRPSLSGFMERAHGKKNKGGNGKVGRRGKLAGWGMQGRYTVETIEF